MTKTFNGKLTRIEMDWTDTGAIVNSSIDTCCPRCGNICPAEEEHRCGDKVLPEVGQVWIDNDKRDGHQREIEIIHIASDSSITNSLFGGGYAVCRNLKTGKETRINLKRFKPTANGYRLKP